MDSDKVICSKGGECENKSCSHNIPHDFREEDDDNDGCNETECHQTKWYVVCKRSPVYAYTKIVKELKDGLQVEDHRQG